MLLALLTTVQTFSRMRQVKINHLTRDQNCVKAQEKQQLRFSKHHKGTSIDTLKKHELLRHQTLKLHPTQCPHPQCRKISQIVTLQKAQSQISLVVFPLSHIYPRMRIINRSICNEMQTLALTAMHKVCNMSAQFISHKAVNASRVHKKYHNQ